VLRECEEYLPDSKRLRDLVILNAKGKTSTGRINSLALTKSSLRAKKGKKDIKKYEKTKGIELVEIR